MQLRGRGWIVVALMAASGAVAPAQAAAAVPAPAERRLREWLEAFNSQDEATYRRFVEANAPAIARYIRDDHRYAVDRDGFVLEALTAAKPTQAEADLSDPWSDATTHLTIKTEDAPPYRILTAELSAPRVREAAILPFASERAMLTMVKRRVRDQARARRFSGVVLLGRGDTVLETIVSPDLRKLYHACEPAALRFNLASIGKLLTATAVMQQVDAGRLLLDDTVARHLPAFANREWAAQATVRQLLQHTAGAGDFFKKRVAEQRAGFDSLADLVDFLDDRAPTAAPGEKHAYSNFGYVVLGRMVEAASGEAWDAYQRRAVLPADPVAAACATEVPGLTRSEDGVGWVARAPGLERWPTPAGGNAASARQLHEVLQGVRSARLVSAASRDALFSATIDYPGGRYALGFQEKVRGGTRSLGHGGTAPGINNEVLVYPASGYTVVVLNRLDPPYGNRLADFIAYRMARLAAADGETARSP
jgi:D-alanyl-D-alanine carboxypeptidase